MNDSKMKQITEHVFYLPHYHEKNKPLNACIIGDDQVLFIDGGASIENMQEMLDEFVKLDYHAHLPQLGVITDHHWNHVLGMQACHFAYISHKLTKDKLQMMHDYDWSDKGLEKLVEEEKLLAMEARAIKKAFPKRKELEIQIPCILYRHQLELDLGHINCKLEHLESDYSEDSTIIYLKEDQVLFLGDCMSFGYHHVTPYYSKRLFDNIDVLLDYDAKYYVFSSENKIMDRNEFIEHCEYLRLLGATVSQNNDDLEAIELELGGSINKEDSKYIYAFIEGLKEGQ